MPLRLVLLVLDLRDLLGVRAGVLPRPRAASPPVGVVPARVVVACPALAAALLVAVEDALELVEGPVGGQPDRVQGHTGDAGLAGAAKTVQNEDFRLFQD